MHVKSIISALALLIATSVAAQTKTTLPTHYQEFVPSVITFADGHSSSQQFTNVFLKNSTLLFLSGATAMEANMDNIVRVAFADRTYINIKGQLAYFVDSVRNNSLYCVELFDQESYERNIRNNVNYANITLGGDALSTTTVDLNNEGDYMMPVIPVYYYIYNGKTIRVHERDIWHEMPKAKRRIYKTIIGENDFSWVEPESLMKLLKAISD